MNKEVYMRTYFPCTAAVKWMKRRKEDNMRDLWFECLRIEWLYWAKIHNGIRVPDRLSINEFEHPFTTEYREFLATISWKGYTVKENDFFGILTGMSNLMWDAVNLDMVPRLSRTDYYNFNRYLCKKFREKFECPFEEEKEKEL